VNRAFEREQAAAEGQSEFGLKDPMPVSEKESCASAGPLTRLRRDALLPSHIVASTLASIAPAMSFFFGFAFIVQGAGLAAPLTILTATVVILFLTNTIAQFSRFNEYCHPLKTISHGEA